MNVVLTIVAVVLSWMALSLVVSFVANPIRWYAYMSHTRLYALTKFVPAPCVLAISYLKELDQDRHFDDKTEWKLRYHAKRAIESLFLFGIPLRLTYLRASMTCAGSDAEYAKSRSEIDLENVHSSYRDMSTVGSHRCHEIMGHLPPVHKLSVILDAMGYDHVVELPQGGMVSTRLTGDEGGIRSLIDHGRTLEEVDAISKVIQCQVDEQKQQLKDEIDNSPEFIPFGRVMDMDSAMRKRLLSRENVAVVAERFRAKVDENPEVPLEILVEFMVESEVAS